MIPYAPPTMLRLTRERIHELATLAAGGASPTHALIDVAQLDALRAIAIAADNVVAVYPALGALGTPARDLQAAVQAWRKGEGGA